MSTWAAQKKFTYLSIIILIIILIGAGLFIYLRPEPTCFDGQQNQGELGVDCGGECEAVCEAETVPLVKKWSRALKVRDGVYNVVAVLENPNRFANENVEYSLKIYDRENLLIREIRNTTFVNPSENFAIIEPAVDTGNRIPARSILEIVSVGEWQRISSDLSSRDLNIKNSQISLNPNPRVTATLVNDSVRDMEGIEVIAVVMDRSGNALGASKTEVDRLGNGESRDIFFTWPEGFTGDVPPNPVIDMFVRVNVLDLEN